MPKNPTGKDSAEMLAGRLLPPGKRPRTIPGRAGSELWLCSSPGCAAHTMGRRCQSGDPPGTEKGQKEQEKGLERAGAAL